MAEDVLWRDSSKKLFKYAPIAFPSNLQCISLVISAWVSLKKLLDLKKNHTFYLEFFNNLWSHDPCRNFFIRIFLSILLYEKFTKKNNYNALEEFIKNCKTVLSKNCWKNTSIYIFKMFLQVFIQKIQEIFPNVSLQAWFFQWSALDISKNSTECFFKNYSKKCIQDDKVYDWWWIIITRNVLSRICNKFKFYLSYKKKSSKNIYKDFFRISSTASIENLSEMFPGCLLEFL